METCPKFSWRAAERLCEWILSWEPDPTESIRWNMLCFSGRKLISGISACKFHLTPTFFRGGALQDSHLVFNQHGRKGTVLSIKFKSLEGLNRAALKKLLNTGVELDTDP